LESLIKQTENPHTNPPNRRILLAEDNPQDVILLTEAFVAEKLDIDIDCVPDGDQLLARLAGLKGDGSGSYGMVLLDVHLPRRSAEEVLILLNAQQRRLGIPMIVLSTLISEQEKTKLLNLGVTDVLSKPFDLNEYFALARKLASFLMA
jgi:two-component system, sensor histidine kinase and response regulator